MYGWVSGSTSGFTRSAMGRPGAHALRNIGQLPQLAGGLDVETADAHIERGRHLVGGFAYAGEHHVLCAATGPQHACQFAAGNNVESGTAGGQQPQQGEVGVGLDGVADPMRDAREGLVQPAIARFDRCARVCKTGCAEALGEPGKSNAFHVGAAGHDRCATRGCSSAGVSGPLFPHIAVCRASRVISNQREQLITGSGKDQPVSISGWLWRSPGGRSQGAVSGAPSARAGRFIVAAARRASET